MFLEILRALCMLHIAQAHQGCTVNLSLPFLACRIVTSFSCHPMLGAVPTCSILYPLQLWQRVSLSLGWREARRCTMPWKSSLQIVSRQCARLGCFSPGTQSQAGQLWSFGAFILGIRCCRFPETVLRSFAFHRDGLFPSMASRSSISISGQMESGFGVR